MDTPQEQRPVPTAYELTEKYPAAWQAAGANPGVFLAGLHTEGIISSYQQEALHQEVIDYQEEARRLVEEPAGFVERIRSWYWEQVREYLLPVLDSVLQKWWESVKKTIGDFVWAIQEIIKPAVETGFTQLNAKMEDIGRRAFDGMSKLMQESGPITPERAPALALKTFAFAFSMGVAAHGSATTFELLHPLKSLGLHSISAMIAQFAGFSRIAGATMGVMTSVALAQPMRYAVNELTRSTIPDEKLLIEFRSKREIDKAQFDKAMGYQGFSKEWIDIIERWQWKDPRMFELMRVADIGIDQGPPPAAEAWWFKKFGITGDKLKDWWLHRKLMRAGYEDCDLDVLVRTIHRREISFAMTYVRTAVRRNYRWGYLSDTDLDEWIDKLQLPEQAKGWISDAGQLDRDYFYRQDLVKLYTTQYRNDIISDDDFFIALTAMGIPERDADLTARIEHARKHPAITGPVIKAAEKAMADAQKKYVQVYIEQFRKDLISEEALANSLRAVGIADNLAEVTALLEATKKFKPAAL